MRARVQVTGDDEAALHGLLWRWLRAEPQLAGRVGRIEAPTSDTLTSGTTIALTVALTTGSGGVAAVLARSLTEWLRPRRSTVGLTLSVGGEQLSLTEDELSKRQVDALNAEILDLIRRQLDAAGPDDDDDG